MDWNAAEGKYNWELVFCELYAGGKYDNDEGENYEYSLGLNGLGACATQYSSRWFDAEIFRDGYQYNLHFERGENVGGLQKKPASRKKTGSRFHWLPDTRGLHGDRHSRRTSSTRSASSRPWSTPVSPSGCVMQVGDTFEETDYCYQNGILDYVTEISEGAALTMPQFWEAERRGRDRADKPEYKVKLSAALCFSNTGQPD